MRMQLWIAASAAALIAADAPKPEAVKEEMAKLQGTWKMASAEIKGKKVPDENIAKITRVVKGDKYEVRNDDQLMNKGTVTLDPTKKPKTMDAVLETTDEDGNKKTSKLLGIYELDGDTMKVCLSAPDKDRPKEFVSKEDNDQNVFVWKRVKEEKKDDKK